MGGDPGVSTLSGFRPESVPVRLGRTGRLLVLGLWLTLGLLESVKGYVGRRLAGQAPDVTAVLAGNLPWWLMWAALTPFVIWMARRFRFEHNPVGATAAHAGAALGLSMLHHVVVGSLYYFTDTRGSTIATAGGLVESTMLNQLERFFAGYFLLNILTYVAVAAAYLGFEFYRRYRDGELRAAQLEAGMHLARLEALRMELNPHFLFNSLNGVAGLVRRGNNGAAVDMLARLSDLLRITLTGDREPEVELRRELDLLEAYLEIEEMRFGDRLEVEFAIEDGVRSAPVPPLLLQPLVENAIRHGIARRPGPGRVTVSARRDGNELVLAVIDSGPGPASQVVGNGGSGGDGRSGRDGSFDADGGGVGLTNVRKRLEELYAGRGVLRLEGHLGGGTAATIRLPLSPSAQKASRSSPSR